MLLSFMAMTRSNGTRSKRHRIPIADTDIGIYSVWELMLNCRAWPGVVGPVLLGRRFQRTSRP